jgi:hypothetical protein
MVGLGQEAKRDVGGVTRGRFNVERERAEKELTARGRGLPFKPVEKEVGRGPGGCFRVEEGEGGGNGAVKAGWRIGEGSGRRATGHGRLTRGPK